MKSSSILSQQEQAEDLLAIEDAIVQAVSYSDVFDYPLRAEEIHRYLVGVPASPVEVCEALSRLAPGPLARVGDYYTLAGREAIVATRRRRAEMAVTLWRRAHIWGRRIGWLPFVRMVAVTGALSVDNSESGDDLDYLIVTEPGRLWLCRMFVVGLVRLAARRGDIVCPNYFISARALVVSEHSLYTAREMAQMVPLTGMAIYWRMRALNPWVETFLPNATGLPRPAPAEDGTAPGWAAPGWQVAAETILRTPLGTWLERWEMRRKLKKLSRQGAASANPAESEFGPDWCKGHFHAHASTTLRAMDGRMRQHAA
jgi:hypothetical protein